MLLVSYVADVIRLTHISFKIDPVHDPTLAEMEMARKQKVSAHAVHDGHHNQHSNTANQAPVV